MTITVYIQGWKTNSRCSGKGDVTWFFFFKADISTLFGLKNEKKTRKKTKKTKNKNKNRNKTKLSAACRFLWNYIQNCISFIFIKKFVCERSLVQNLSMTRYLHRKQWYSLNSHHCCLQNSYSPFLYVLCNDKTQVSTFY